MTLHSKIFSSTILLFLFCVIAYGQKGDSIVGRKHLTVFQIDSICNFIDNNKKLSEGIIEGEFYNQKGGWETYDLKSKEGDTLFRIRHNSSTDLYHKTVFYYFNREVIKSIVKIEDWHSGSTMEPVYSATYYFQNNIPIKVLNEDPKYSTTSDVLKQGQNYQDDFYHNR
jgi:hypothetical protein